MEWFRRKERGDETGPEDPDEPEREARDPLQEVAAALRVRRWTVRDEPFQGFGSPTGKF